MAKDNIRLIVGLGNYGDKYLQDRHNVGFLAIDRFYDNLSTNTKAVWQNKFNGRYVVIDNPNKTDDSTIEKIILLKPWSYMNVSGQPLQSVIAYYKISPKQVVVIHDELDLAPGKLRLKFSGGTAGHNGLKSISQAIGADYWRIRIGIGHPGSRELVVPYVLSRPPAEERIAIEDSLKQLQKQQDEIFSKKLEDLKI